ncbi:hypothetical protein HPB51_020283 [Rhipicephalus microplus]|uniref:Uncharacterized protein n=1 Tax=Rhipicephalus microplus TaxID=6941 RepID=A0A9J6DBZ2_RHIMP|nr:hypothetical protein HPB51_020283 [Rhipicephalus microplus]
MARRVRVRQESRAWLCVHYADSGRSPEEEAEGEEDSREQAPRVTLAPVATRSELQLPPAGFEWLSPEPRCRKSERWSLLLARPFYSSKQLSGEKKNGKDMYRLGVTVRSRAAGKQPVAGARGSGLGDRRWATTDSGPDSSEVVPGRPLAQRGRPSFLVACFDVSFRVFAEKVVPGTRAQKGLGVIPVVVECGTSEASARGPPLSLVYLLLLYT